MPLELGQTCLGAGLGWRIAMVAVLAAVVSCSSDRANFNEAEVADHEKVPPLSYTLPSGLSLSLKSTGAGAKRSLRYQPEFLESQTVVFISTGSVRMGPIGTGAAFPAPALPRVEVDLTVLPGEGADASGREVEVGAGAPRVSEHTADSVAGHKGKVVLSLAGPSRPGDLMSLLGGPAYATAAFLLAPYVPGEPVGIGAEWVVTWKQSDVEVEIGYRFIEILGNGVRLQVRATAHSRESQIDQLQTRSESIWLGTGEVVVQPKKLIAQVTWGASAERSVKVGMGSAGVSGINMIQTAEYQTREVNAAER